MTTIFKSNVRALFTHPTSDQQLFARIQQVTGTHLRGSRLLLELYAPGPVLPLPWLQTLTCVVKNHAGQMARANIEKIVQYSNGYIIVMTEELTHAVDEAAHHEAGAVITINSPSGLQRIEPLEPERRVQP